MGDRLQADHLEDGNGFRIPSILDEHTRVIREFTADVFITGEDLVRVLERLSISHGCLALLRIDNGPRPICRAPMQSAEEIVELPFIPHGEPWKNGWVEMFHSRQQNEFLNTNTFPRLQHARVEPTDWHYEYNNILRCSSLGYQAPSRYAQKYAYTEPD